MYAKRIVELTDNSVKTIVFLCIFNKKQHDKYCRNFL